MTRPLPTSTTTSTSSLHLLAVAALLAAASLAALPCRAAEDDAAVANRKWVRAQLAKIESRLNPDTNAFLTVADTTSVRYSATIPLGGGTNLVAEISTPTNNGLFVAWSSVPDLIPPYSFYAQVPGACTYANVSNAYLREIHYSSTNWTETAVRDGETVTCEHMRTKWRAVSADGSAWHSAAWDGDTYLSMETNEAVYVIIRRTAVTDAKRDALLAGYGASVAAQAPPSLGSRLLALLDLAVPSALADGSSGPTTEHVREVERGGGTLGYHAPLQLGFTITIKALGSTFTVTQKGDHQYNPFSGLDHKDLAAGDAKYSNWSVVSNPENWGFAFPMEFKDVNGNKASVTKKQFQNSPEWTEFVRNVQLPKPNVSDEPDIEDASSHKTCLVWDNRFAEDGGENPKDEWVHVGCACDYRQCPWYYGAAEKGLTQFTYPVTVSWSNGDVETVTKTNEYVGAKHNWQWVSCRLDGGALAYRTDDKNIGCYVCFQDPDNDETHFCGDGSQFNLIKSKDLTEHNVNVPKVTGRDECGCACRENWATEKDYVGHSDNLQQAHHVMNSLRTNGGYGNGILNLSTCWCICNMKHGGDFPAADSTTDCKGHCRTCGCCATYEDGGKEYDMYNHVHSYPMDYRIAADGLMPEDPAELLKDHVPASVKKLDRCGCACGAFIPESDYLYSIFKEEGSFHTLGDGSDEKVPLCTCRCRRQFHIKYKREGNEDCTKVCDICGCVNETVEGVVQKRQSLPEDHTPDATRCGCQCYNNASGHVPAGARHCGFSGVETADFPKFHQRIGKEYCACVCGVYANHAANNGLHKDWFVPGDCEKICGARTATEDFCRLTLAGEKPVDADHAPKGDETCGCKCGEMDTKPDALAFHFGKSAYPCMCQCGYCHLYPDIRPDECAACRLCGLTATLALPTSEDLHKPNPDAPCAGFWYGPENTEGTNVTGKVEAAQECVCYCGWFGSGNHKAESPELHKYTGENADGVANCTCDCKLVHDFRDWPSSAKGARTENPSVFCPVCAYCRDVKRGEKEDSPPVPAEEADHVQRDKAVDGTKCGCKCGKLDASATLEKFHPRYPGGCRCYGEKGDGRGAWHYSDADTDCPNVCRTLIDGVRHKVASCAYGHAVREGTVEAGEADHTPKTAACGCRCGDFTKDSIAADSPLHVQNPNSCGCYCGAKPKSIADHRFASGSCTCHCGDVHRTDWPRKACKTICTQCDKAVYKTESLATASGVVTVGFARTATEADHDAQDAACGCKCGAYAPVSLSSSSKLHTQNPTTCYCYCGVVPDHKWASGACRCFCKSYHVATYRKEGCEKVCGSCGNLVDSPNTRATAYDHTPKSGGCGCACGDYAASAYDASTDKGAAYHGGVGPTSCHCECGAVHSNFYPSDCPLACAVCGRSRDDAKSDSSIHVWGASCKCNCQKFTDHKYATDACYCYCGTRFRGHDYSKASDTVTSTYTCATCSQEVEKHHAVYTCLRCGDKNEADYESGHAWNCGTGSNDEPYSQHCDGCGCDGCSCSSCQNLSGICTACGNRCGEDKPTEGGGESGGSGGIDDI